MSLQAAGTLMMVFQAAVVAVAAGLRAASPIAAMHARCSMAGPLVSATVLSLDGTRAPPGDAGAWCWCAAAWAWPRSIRRAPWSRTPPARDRPGTAMSVFVTSGSIGFALSPLLVANAAGRYGLGATVLVPAAGRRSVRCSSRGRFRRFRSPRTRLHGGGLRAPRPQARNLFLLYLLVVPRTVVLVVVCHLRARAADTAGLGVGEAGTAMSLYFFLSGVGLFFGGRLADQRSAPRRVIVWSLLLATPFLLMAPQTQGWAFRSAGDRRPLPAVDAASQRQLRAGTGPAQRGDRLVLDDGRGLGTGGMLVPFIGMVG